MIRTIGFRRYDAFRLLGENDEVVAREKHEAVTRLEAESDLRPEFCTYSENSAFVIGFVLKFPLSCKMSSIV